MTIGEAPARLDPQGRIWQRVLELTGQPRCVCVPHKRDTLHNSAQHTTPYYATQRFLTVHSLDPVPKPAGSPKL